jgi:glycosyltransferase involved in cell wall biosynthesis
MSFVGQISHLAGKHVRVEYFPSWAEEVFSTERAAPAAEVPVDVESFNVLFAGNIGESQDFPAILEAASIARANGRIRWLIVGDGRAAPWVSMEIERRGLEGCVLMLGRFPLARMPSFFKHADALLVSLRDEPVFAMTIPGKLQAYLASGVPIVAMMNGEGAEVVRRAQCGVACSAGDSAALAEAVVELSGRTREERADMGRRGIQLSVNTFGRKKLITQLEKWMAELA